MRSTRRRSPDPEPPPHARRSAEPFYPRKRRTERVWMLLERRPQMIASEDAQPPDRDVEGSEDVEEDPGEELEATIEQADRPLASESFGTTAEEQEEGESLDQRLAQERPS